MKFQIRDGFVIHLSTVVDLGDGQTQVQQQSFFGGQRVDLDKDQADLHAHKLEPKDKAAEDYLAAKVLPSQDAVPGLSAEQLALVQAMAAEMAKAILAGVQAPAQGVGGA